MPKTKIRQPRKQEAKVQVEQAPWGPVLTQWAFVMMVALVIARALMAEVLRDAFDAVPKGESSPRGPGAATSLVLDMLSWVPAMLVLVRRVIEKDYTIRLRASHVLIGLFALWAVVSTLWASDKFAALVTGVHMLTAAIVIWSTTQLVRSWLRLRLVAAVCFGVLLAYLAQGVMYRFV